MYAHPWDKIKAVLHFLFPSVLYSMYVNFLNDNVIEISSDDSGSELKDEGLHEAISQSLKDQR